jgi:hypothetical protein
VPILDDLWSVIEKEKVSGYAHRAPKRKQSTKMSVVKEIVPSKCYINVQNLLNENIETDHSTIVKTNSPSPTNINKVINIDTECF